MAFLADHAPEKHIVEKPPVTMASPTYSSSFYTTPNGTKTHYLQTGDARGPLLIALHGLGGSTATFEPLVAHLPQSNNIVLVDFQGFGKTPLADPENRLSISGHVSDLHHLVAHLQANHGEAAKGKVTVLGHSLGTIVGMHYAAEHPENVAGLALLGSGRSASHIPAARQGMLDTAAKVREQGLEYAANLAANKTNFPADSDARTIAPEIRQAVHDAVAASDQEGYAQTCEAIMGLDHKDPDYAKITCPAVFIAGDMDPISPVQRSKDISALLGGETSVEVVKSGHQPILEDLPAVTEVIVKFLGQTRTS